MVTLLLGSLVASLFIGLPIAIALAITTVIVFTVHYPDIAMVKNLAQAMVTSVDSFPLLAVPFFMLVGSLMDKGGIANSLVNFAEALVGRFTGGLGLAAIVASMLFASITGSGPAEVAAMGSIMIPLMVKRGYDRDYSGALIASSATMGPVIPPSIPLIIYGVTVGVSITQLFLAAIIPGVLLGVGLMIVNYFISKKRGYVGVQRDGTPKEHIKYALSEAWKAKWALFLPVVILGGIYSGVFTPTEAAVVGVVYAWIIGKFVFKELSTDKLKICLVESALLSAIVMFLLGGAKVLGRLLTLERIPEMIAQQILDFTSSPVLILLLINLLLLITGMFIDPISNIILLAPLFLPLVVQLGYDPIFFGIIMTINLCIGLLTPPVGMNLFVAQSVAKVPLERIIIQLVPLFAVLVLTLIILIIFPQIVMFLPNWLG